MRSFKFIPDNTKFDFIGKRRIAFIFSIVVMIGTFALMGTKGFNFGIDFTGGTLIEAQVPAERDLSQIRASLNKLDLGDVSLQEFGGPRDLLIRLPQKTDDEGAQQANINKVREALDSMFPGQIEYRRTEYVGPQVGSELKKKAFYAVIFSLIGILAYVWFRFEWQFGLACILATLHDVLATVGLFSLTGMQFDLTALAAVLTIAGYSVNDTVVIFDRIRETMRKYKKMPMAELMNKAVNDTLSRTIMTGSTTLLALGALWLFGGEVIRGFVYALIFGILFGTYSSVFIAAALLLYLGVRRSEEKAEADDKAQESIA